MGRRGNRWAKRPDVRQVDGVCAIVKPTGMTSAQALYRFRDLTRVAKSGHAGTLDPLADGVLVLGLGKGTKWIERLMGLAKTYRAGIRLDATSDTLDADGAVETVPVTTVPDRAALDAAIADLTGAIMQVPPAFSALKQGGKRAHERARAGETVELAPRPARVDAWTVHRYDFPLLDASVRCGRGTYVRALARDLGAALGCGGMLTSLRREAVGPFDMDRAWTLEALAEVAAGDAWITPLAALPALMGEPSPGSPRQD